MSERARAWWLGWGLVLGVGSMLRFHRFGAQLLVDDEWHALHMVVGSSYGAIATRFGWADHCIPLTLLYEFLANHAVLSEPLMRLPALLAGIGAIALVPWAFARWLRPGERLLLGALIAIAPLLVYFSRTARPYALVFLLASLALPLAYRWWQERRRGPGLAFGASAVLSAWLHPLSMACVLAPFPWFAAQALAAARRRRELRPLRRLLGLALPVALAIALLIGPPLVQDWESLARKTGTHAIGLDTWRGLLELYSGSGRLFVGVAFVVLAGFGLRTLLRRDAGFGAYLLFCTGAFVLTVSLTSAIWIQHALVLARYLLPTLAVLLLLVSVGALDVLRRLGLRGAPGLLVTLGALAGLLWAGPIAWQYERGGQFTGHMRYQFSYRSDRNPYAVLDAVPVPALYRDIAASFPPHSMTVVEVPWHFEWHRNVLYRYQQVHRQRVRAGFVTGLCAEQRAGEYPAGEPGLRFRHFVHLADLVAAPAPEAIVVFHRRRPDWVPEDQWPAGLEACIDAFRSAYGEPWRENPGQVAFRLQPRPGSR